MTSCNTHYLLLKELLNLAYLNEGDAKSDASQHETDVLQVGQQLGVATLHVEVGRAAGAGDDDAAVDLLA